MNIRQYAERIPDEVRSKRLMVPSEPIKKAVAYSENPQMQLLFLIWKEFIENMNDLDIGCPQCLKRILDNFQQMEPALIELEKQYQLLLSIK